MELVMYIVAVHSEIPFWFEYPCSGKWKMVLLYVISPLVNLKGSLGFLNFGDILYVLYTNCFTLSDIAVAVG
jgi:hypothetical protein